MNVSESKSDSLRQKKTGMLEKVQKAYEQIVANIERLANSNNDLVERVEEYKDMQSFADMANTALSLMAETGSEELERMLSLEAFRSIDNEFASAIAKVDGFSQDLQLEKMEA